jgi:hypothetical protein
MYDKIRKKLAQSVSEVETTEQFVWHKWLRRPVVEEMTIGNFNSRIVKTDHLNKAIEIPANETRDLKLSKPKLLKYAKKFYLTKSKTNTIFFGFGKPYPREIRFKHEFKISMLFSSSFIVDKLKHFYREKKKRIPKLQYV